jgi:hypothetical protein
MLVGLQPRFTVAAGQLTNTGALLLVQMNTCTQVLELPQPSVAV